VPTKLFEYADYYGAYIQDDFRITKKVTINFGMRYEREYGCVSPTTTWWLDSIRKL